MNDRCQIQKVHQIGSGSFSRVFSALANNKYLIAIKDFRHMVKEPEILNEIYFLQKYRSQQYFISYLGNSNIELYLELGLCDLKQFVNIYGKLDTANALKIFTQLILSVQELHKLGFAHRDIKPQNFILSKDGFFKLCDFGSFSPKNERNNQCVGNELYKPTSQTSAQVIDIYALAGILQFMLQGNFDQTFFSRDPQILQVFEKLTLQDEKQVIQNFKFIFRDTLLVSTQPNSRQINIQQVTQDLVQFPKVQANIFKESLQQRVRSHNYQNQLDPGEYILFACKTKSSMFKSSKLILITSYSKIKGDFNIDLSDVNLIRSKQSEIIIDNFKIGFQSQEDADNLISQYYQSKFVEYKLLKCMCGHKFQGFCSHCKLYVSIQNKIQKLDTQEWKYLHDTAKQHIISQQLPHISYTILNKCEQTQYFSKPEKPIFSNDTIIIEDNSFSCNIDDYSISELSLGQVNMCNTKQIKDLKLSIDEYCDEY